MASSLSLGGPTSAAVDEAIRDTIGTPSSPTIAGDLAAIQTKTDNLPLEPAAEPLVEAHVTAEVDSIKGVSWSDETLKKIKELVQAIPRGGFKI